MKTMMSKNGSAHRTKYLKPFYRVKSQYLSTMRNTLMNKDYVHKLSFSRGLMFLFCISMIISAISAALPTVAALSPVQINLNTNNSSYYTMQTVGLYANLTAGGVPKYDGMLAVEVDQVNTSSPSWNPILFRSAKGSQSPNPALFDNNLQIVSVTPIKDLFTYKPVQGFTCGTLSYFNVTVLNSGPLILGMITASVFDCASTPVSVASLGTATQAALIEPGITQLGLGLIIHTWASAGTAVIYVNIFSGSPSVYGYPLTPEKSVTFQIYGRTQTTSSSGPSATESYPDNSVASTNIKGAYNLSWRVPPYTVLGDYVAYAASNYTNATPNYASDTFQVAADPVPPQASFTYSPSTPYVGIATYFDASSSFSYNGTITNYRWNWGDGSPQNSTSNPVVAHTFNSAGAFLVTLNVTDSQNLWSTAQKPVSVSAYTPPVASFTFKPSPTWVGASTTFNASASTPGWNGTGYPPIVNYAWNFGDGTGVVNTANPVTSHQFTTLGNYTTVLTVTDTRGWNGQVSHKVQVGIPGMSPQASFTYSPSTPYKKGATSFDASASFSYYGTITNYLWNWGDGSPKNSTSNPVVTHNFTSAGTFLVTLNVTDSQNLWSTTQKPVKVLPPTPPVASFTFKPSPTWVGASTTFNASASTPGWNGTGYPPIVNYAWNFGDGTAVVNTANPVTSHQFTTLGNFTTTLTVTDTRGSGWSGQTSHIVQVVNVTQHPDVAVTNVGFASPPAGLYQIAPNYYEPYKGWTGNITVTVFNNGTSAASFSVTVYYSNGTSYSLGTKAVSNLASQASTLLTYQWNTSPLKPTMNYTITANATILLGETNTKNNYYSIVARVKGAGDINGDGTVGTKDLHILGVNWGLAIPPGDPRADINGDGLVGTKDLHILGVNWGKSY